MFRTLIILFIVIFNSLPAFADGVCSAVELRRIDEYLNKLDKVAIKFTQISTDDTGAEASGLLLIQKPSRFRINYDLPHPLLIVGTKNFISIYDYDLDELSRVDSSDNVFKFLLELNVSIQKSVAIEKCYSMENSFELLVKHKGTDQKAVIIFDKHPMKLKEMSIPNDGNDITKGAVIIDLQEYFYYTKPLGRDMFSMKDVKIFGSLKRYTSDEILKNIIKK